MRFVGPPTLALVCMGFSFNVSAQESVAPLDFRAALERALAGRQELAGFEFAMRAQDGRVAEARLTSAMQLEAMVEDVGGTGDRHAFDAAQTTLSLSRVLELGGKREGRVALADAGVARTRTERAVAQLDIVADVAHRFIDALEGERLLAIARDGVDLAAKSRDAAARRVEAGGAPLVESARADVALMEARLAREHARHELESRRQFLAAAMGERSIAFGAVSGDLTTLEMPLPFEQLRNDIEASPEYVLFADDARLRDAELRLAELKRRPDIRVEFGVRHYEQGDGTAFVAGVGIPLGSGRRAQSAIAIAQSERDRIGVERDAWLTRVTAQLFAQYQELEHARIEFEALRGDVIPRLEQVVDATDVAYRRGRYSYLELTDAQRSLLDARRRAYQLAASFQGVRIEIERLTGKSLEPNGGNR